MIPAPNPAVAIPVVASAVAATTVAIVPPLYRLVANKIKDVIARYNDKEVAELLAVQKHYIECCYALEKLQHPSTLLFRDPQNTQGSEKKYPIHFEINVETKYPKLYEDNFCPNNDASYWENHLSYQSILAHYCTETINYLCEYSRLRSLKFFGRGFNYDPTNIFFDELKCWFVALSKVELTVETLENVKARVRFLDKVFNDPHIFSPGDPEFNRKDAVKYVRDILKKNIIPNIELYISRTSAREHLKNVTTNLSFIVRNTTKFLFYVFREPTVNPNFILEQVQTPTLAAYKTYNETISGKLLNALTLSKPFLVIFPLMGVKLELVEISNSNHLKDFMDLNKQVHLPIIKSANISVNNWFLTENNSGIYPEFQRQRVMDSYIRLHGYIQQLCLSTVISNLFFELAGDGGNLLVYGASISEIKSFVADYEIFKRQFIAELKFIFETAQFFQERKIRDPKTNDEMKKWLENFNVAKESYDRILQLFERNDSVIESIKSCINKVNSAEYVREVRARLQALSNYINLFHLHVSGKEISKEEQSYNSKLSIFSPSAQLEEESECGSKKNKNMLTAPSGLIIENLPELLQRANCLLEESPEEALTLYDVILNQGVEKNIEIEILLNRVAVFFSIDSPGEAFQGLEKVIELDPKNHDALFAYGRMLYEDRKYEEAINILGRFVNSHPNSEFREQADEIMENSVSEINSSIEIKLK